MRRPMTLQRIMWCSILVLWSITLFRNLTRIVVCCNAEILTKEQMMDNAEFHIALHMFEEDNNTNTSNESMERMNRMKIFPRHQVPQVRQIHEPHALWMAVNIREIALLPGDQLILSDAYNLSRISITRENQTMVHRAWTQRFLWNHPFLMLGNKVTIEYWPSITTLVLPINRKQLDNAIAVIDSYTFVYRVIDVDRSDHNMESTVGAVNEMKPAICYKTKHPTMYRHARAVARLLIRREDDDSPKQQQLNHDKESNAWNFCTGWLIGRGNHMLTNYHCFYTSLQRSNPRGIVTFSSLFPTDAVKTISPNAVVNFMAEALTCRNGTNTPNSIRSRRQSQRTVTVAVPSGIIESSNVTVLAANEQLDYCLVRLNTNDTVDLSKKYGYLTLRGPPLDGEEIYIPQHPHGAVKMIASTKNGEPSIIRVSTTTTSSSSSSSNLQSINGDLISTTTFDNVSVWYNADTAPGSSGSPVLSQHDHSVIALHHAGTGQATHSMEDPMMFNSGIRMDAIIKDMQEQEVLPPCALALEQC